MKLVVIKKQIIKNKLRGKECVRHRLGGKKEPVLALGASTITEKCHKQSSETSQDTWREVGTSLVYILLFWNKQQHFVGVILYYLHG